MKNIVILQSGGGWFVNIGNAFLDLGSMESLRQACNNAEIHLASDQNRLIFYYMRKGLIGRAGKKNVPLSDVFNVQQHAKIDYIVQSGAFLGEDWINVFGEVFLNLTSKGTRVIINGGGMTDEAYTKKEIEKTREFLKKIKPYIFISRDKLSFDSFKDLAEYSYDGIDCGFFINDAYKPLQLDLPPYIILNFDKRAESSVENLNIDRGKEIIRIHHSFWLNFSFLDYLKMRKEYYWKKNTMISELPYDYLNLYANTEGTYSDRVHACVGTFSYGKPSRLISGTMRSFLFERIGASEITKELTMPNIKLIETEKEKQIKFLSEIIRKN